MERVRALILHDVDALAIERRGELVALDSLLEPHDLGPHGDGLVSYRYADNNWAWR